MTSLPATLNIAAVQPLHAALCRGEATALDGSAVAVVTSPGLQLLLAAKLKIENPSEALLIAIEELSLSSFFREIL